MKDILIVDDQPMNLRLLTEMLDVSDYSVRAALNGSLALQAVQVKLPDLVLLDIKMPDMDGYEVCTRLKTDERTQDIPIIFLSALDEVVDKVRAFALGAVDYITKPFNTEEVLLRVKNHLSLCEAKKQLESKNAQLKTALRQLKASQDHVLQSEKMASIGRLSAGIAHEINNPLSFIASNQSTMQAYVERLRTIIGKYRELQVLVAEQVAGKFDRESCLELLEDVRKVEKQLNLDFMLDDAAEIQADNQIGVERIQKIVSGLSEFVKTDDETYQEADLHQEIETVLSVMAAQISDRIAVTKDYGQLPKIECYRNPLRQVFLNLIDNAIKAMGEEGELFIRTRCLKNKVQIQIRDSGGGIQEDKLGWIFDPFFSTRAVGQGVGLGLSIAYSIINQHCGEIKVENAPEQGAVFTITLPVRQQGESAVTE